MNCTSCGQPIHSGSRFCGYCGTPIAETSSPPQPEAAPKAKQQQARLILIKGEGFDGVSYQLNAEEHLMGRLHGTILFPEDQYLSMRHANLIYKDDKLLLRDESSTNGVYVKIKKPVVLKDGALFLSGEQLLRFERVNTYQNLPDVNITDETKFYGCPPEDKIYFRIVHLFRDGNVGAVFYATTPSINIGREQCELSFPFDRHISGRHARVYQDGDTFYLQDLGSKNGTFYGITEDTQLNHGDYFFVGQQLMRIELNAS